MLNKDMKIIPGDLFEVKVDDSKFYFLCTTVNQNESKTLNAANLSLNIRHFN